MQNLSSQTSPAQDPIPFGEEIDDVTLAVEITGECDFAPTSDGPITGRRCVACKVFEPDGGDQNYDGTHAVAVPSENLVACAACGECYIHPACAVTVECIVHDPCPNASDRKPGLCPHCAYLEKERMRAELERDTLFERAAAFTVIDVRSLIHDLDAPDLTQRDRETIVAALGEIAESAFAGFVAGTKMLARSTMQALPMAGAA